MIASYDWDGGTEAMLRFGPDSGPVVIAALPLFEEANRIRALVVTVLRLLADRGVAGALPDMPGQGESLIATDTITIEMLRTGFAAACASLGNRPIHVLSIRSGALVECEAQVQSRWRLAPQSGPELLRDMDRVARASELGGSKSDPLEHAGNRLSQTFIDGLRDADGGADGPVRVIRTSEGQPGTVIEGPALWRRSEPDTDPVFAAKIADDIAQWIATCEG